MDRMWKAVSAFMVLGLVLSGCGSSGDSNGGGGGGGGAGGGGGGGGGGGATQSAGSAAASIQQAFSALSIGIGGLSVGPKPSVATLKGGTAGSLLKTASAVRQEAVLLASQGTAPHFEVPGVCTEGTADFDLDVLTSAISLVYNECLLAGGGDVDITMDLTMTIVPPPAAMLDPLCGYNAYDFTLDGTQSVVGIDIDQTTTFDQYNMNTSFNDQDPLTCVPTSLVMNSNGGIALDDNLIATNSFSMTMDNLSIDSTAVSGGDQISVSGGIDMESSCFSGSMTVSTPENLFIPEEGDCPTGGQVNVSGDVSGSATYTDTGGVVVDDGGSTTPYDSCEDVVACI